MHRSTEPQNSACETSSQVGQVRARQIVVDIGSLPLNTGERGLLLWSMVVLNEINLLHSCVFTSMAQSDDTSPSGLAKHNQTLFFLQLLAGKLSEAWDAFERDHQESTAFTSRLPYLPSKAQEGYRAVSEYFRHRKNPITMMRNWMGFHYGKQLSDALDKLPRGTQVHIWRVPERTANFRFDVGSQAASQEMNREFPDPAGTKGYHRFLYDVIQVLSGFGLFLSALVAYLAGLDHFEGGEGFDASAGGPGTMALFVDLPEKPPPGE
jgi:hypothetical protein